MEEVPENGKESSYSAHATGMNEWVNEGMNEWNEWYIVKIFFRWNTKDASKRTEFKLQTQERGNENEDTTETKSVSFITYQQIVNNYGILHS